MIKLTDLIPINKQKSNINERSDYQIYHKTTSDALDEVKEFVRNQGYTVDEDEWFSKVATGGTKGRARPSVGDTHKFSVALEKNGEPVKEQVHFQIYAKENGKFELNAYIQ